jgi:hypothetical protein
MASGFIGTIAAAGTLSVTVQSLAKVLVQASGTGTFQINSVAALFFPTAGGQFTVYVAPGTYTFGAVTLAMQISMLEE